MNAMESRDQTPQRIPIYTYTAQHYRDSGEPVTHYCLDEREPDTIDAHDQLTGEYIAWASYLKLTPYGGSVTTATELAGYLTLPDGVRAEVVAICGGLAEGLQLTSDRCRETYTPDELIVGAAAYSFPGAHYRSV